MKIYLCSPFLKRAVSIGDDSWVNFGAISNDYDTINNVIKQCQPHTEERQPKYYAEITPFRTACAFVAVAEAVPEGYTLADGYWETSEVQNPIKRKRKQ